LDLWIHPYLPATELVNHFAPLAAYLEKELGQPVRVKIQSSYQSHIDFVGQNHADLAFMGPAGYVAMRRQYSPKPLLAKLEEKGSPFFRGMIIVPRDFAGNSLTDLKGKSFAFGDPNSTMSYIVPRAMLQEAGVTLADLKRHDHLKSHHDVALAVLGGYFDAGAVKDEVFEAYSKRGLRALATSPPVPDHIFVTRSDLPPQLVARLRTLLLAIKQHPQGQEIMGAIKGNITGLVPVEAKDYDQLEKMMRSVIGD